MKTKLVLCLAVAGLAVAYAKSFSLSLYQPATLGRTELKAGQYQIELDGQKAVVKRGKMRAEAPVTVETADRTYETTSIVINRADGKEKIQEQSLDDVVPVVSESDLRDPVLGREAIQSPTAQP